MPSLTDVQKDARRFIIQEEMGARGAKCCACSATDELEWHHLDPRKKKYKISNLVHSGTIVGLRAELAKCVLLCRDCHVTIHRKYNQGMRYALTIDALVAAICRPRKKPLRRRFNLR